MENGAVISKDRLCASLCQLRLSQAHNEKWWGPAVPHILSPNWTSLRDWEKRGGERGRSNGEEVRKENSAQNREKKKKDSWISANQQRTEGVTGLFKEILPKSSSCTYYWHKFGPKFQITNVFGSVDQSDNSRTLKSR